MSYRVTDILRNTVVSISMSFDELNQIDDYCDKHNISRSELMRDAVKIVLWMREDSDHLRPERRKSDVDEYFDAMEEQARQQNEAACAPE